MYGGTNELYDDLHVDVQHVRCFSAGFRMTRPVRITPEDVAAVVNPGERLDAATICVRVGGYHRRTVSTMLVRAAEQGLLFREYVKNTSLASVRGDKEVRYSVPGSLLDVTPAPYPRVLLNVPPADAQIGRDLWRHARLAAAVRMR